MDRRIFTNRRGRTSVFALLALALVALWATPVLAIRVPTDPEPDIACPADYGTGTLTQYATTVETPADSTDWWVMVEFTIAGEGASCELTLASYELPSAEFTYPQTLFDSATGTFGPGQHQLMVALPLEGALPDCYAQYDFVFGPAIQELTFEDRYDQRQVRARIVGGECPEVAAATPTPTPTPTATPVATPVPTAVPTPTETEVESPSQVPATSTPREDTLGGNPTPTAGTLPDTSLQAANSLPGTLAAVLAVVFLSAVAGLTFATQRSRRR